MQITNDIKYIGVNDHQIDLFEGQYVVPNGMAYNSYAIIDEKIAVMDTVDRNFTHEWLDNIQAAVAGKPLAAVSLLLQLSRGVDPFSDFGGAFGFLRA